MVCTGRVDYYGRVAIFSGVDIGRPLLRVYIIAPSSDFFIIIIVVVVIIFSR